VRQTLLIIATVVVLLALLGFVGISRPLRGARAWTLLAAGVLLVAVAWFAY
jgi:protein-S-isoprenylcysteine O-methyltransferase Ste14